MPHSMNFRLVRANITIEEQFVAPVFKVIESRLAIMHGMKEAMIPYRALSAVSS